MKVGIVPFCSIPATIMRSENTSMVLVSYSAIVISKKSSNEERGRRQERLEFLYDSDLAVGKGKSEGRCPVEETWQRQALSEATPSSAQPSFRFSCSWSTI
ncbi:hypothetical protein SAY87_014644 [Trapa incisa]|uniref:Uncharacterized protein n=1 Tax=Trapa incisa TaxID=236973 RepID=A0AAN7JLU4_9MYRT|nr:hypothetical protein SAY87_014644 [Trapa incisa]